MATWRPYSEFEPVMDPNYDASERAYVRAAARRRWLRANGVETGPIKPRSAYRRLVSEKAKATNRAFGDPTELCGTLLLFCSPAGAWISGQVLCVDGGLTLRP